MHVKSFPFFYPTNDTLFKKKSKVVGVDLNLDSYLRSCFPGPPKYIDSSLILFLALSFVIIVTIDY